MVLERMGVGDGIGNGAGNGVSDERADDVAEPFGDVGLRRRRGELTPSTSYGIVATTLHCFLVEAIEKQRIFCVRWLHMVEEIGGRNVEV